MRKPWRSKRALVPAGVLAVIAAMAAIWYFSSSRVIKVWAYTDYAFRINHPDWPQLIEARFQEVNRIYQTNGTGVIFKVLNDSLMDPTSTSPSVDIRRANMALHFDKPTDIYVSFTGVQQRERTGAANPFTRVAMIIDYPDKTESLNARLLAHELAHLFGAPRDPAWFQTLMEEKPESNQLSPRTVAIIRKMRRYPFALGIDGLSQGSWGKTALQAVSEDDLAAQGNAMAHAHSVLAISLIDERRFAPALEHFRAAVKADPKDKTMHLNLAEAYTRDGQYDKALGEAREAVRLAPDDPLSHRALGALLGRNGQPEAALQELRTAVGMDPKNSQNKVLLGLEYAAMFGHLDDAVSTLQEAAAEDPSPSVQNSLEKAESLKARVEAELVRQRAWVKDHPDDANGHYRLARAEARSGDLAGAIRDYQRASELLPDDGNTHVELAEVYLVKGDTKTAWDEIHKARELGVEPPPSLMARLPALK